MSYKAPSEGQKVTPGQTAPIRQESAGAAPEASLAAESLRAGGGFAENRGVRLEEATTIPSVPEGTNNTAMSSSNQKQGEAAPTYLAGQFARDTSGPHGRNLTEGGFAGSGTAEGALPEPGSARDPGREALRRMEMVQTKQGRDAGERQTGLSGGSKFDALERKRAA